MSDFVRRSPDRAKSDGLISIDTHLKYSEYEDEDRVITSHTVEVFDPTLPRYSMRNRLKNYVNFLDSEE
jgi:hypothetical protein